MSGRHELIRAALEMLAIARAPAWLPAAADASGFVVTLHRVVPASDAAFQPNALLSITPEFLDRLLGHLKAKGWRFVPIDEITAPGRADPRRIAVTLDDGYRDNLVHALPVFQHYQVPFTVYVCPGFTERTSEIWWEALERIIAAVDSIEAPDEPKRALPTRSPAEKERAFFLWRRWLATKVDEAGQRGMIRALSKAHGLDLAELARDLVMDWDEVSQIAADPLCSIGAHTMTHPTLAKLSREAALAEIAASVEAIAAKLGSRPTSLAFPYGNPAAAGAREAVLTNEAGLRASFTTQPGYIPAQGMRHGLPRVSVNGLFQEPRFLDVLLTPGLWDIRTRIRKAS
jgi:peptidoglycan/xylan/chitin deacetylase (PgdA/CDA1 family)